MAMISCHECGESISDSAAACPKCGAAPKKPLHQKNLGCGPLILLGVFALFIMYMCSDTASTPPNASPQASSAGQVRIGNTAVLRVDSGDVVVMATVEAFREFTKLAVANDTLGMVSMEVGGRLFRVPSGTRARVIDSGLDRREVRILEGPSIGKSGWVVAALVHPEN